VSETDPAPVSVAPAPRLFRDERAGPALGVYLPAMAVFRFVGLVRNVVLAWFIDKSQFGLLLLALLIVNVLAPITSLSLHEAVTRYAPLFERRGALRWYLRRVVPMLLVIALTTTTLLAMTAYPVGNWLFRSLQSSPMSAATAQGVFAGGELAVLTRWVAATLFALAAYNFVMGALRGLRMFRALSLMELTQTVLFTGGAIAVACFGSASAGTIVLTYLAALVVATSVFGLALRCRVHGWSEQQAALTDRERVVGRMLRFSVWTAIAAVAWQTLQIYPTWYLNKVHGHEAIAVFGGMRTIAQGVLLAATPVITVVMTMVTRAWEVEGREAADRRFRLAFKATVLVLFAGSAVVAALRHPIMRLFPASYGQGAVVAQPLLLFFLLAADLTFLSIQFSLIEKTRLLMWPWAVGVAANVVIAWLWVRPAGAGCRLSISEQLMPTAQGGVVAMAAALVVCLLLLRMERRRVDRGSWVVMAAGFALCLPWQAGLLVATGLLLLARPLIFTQEEAATLRVHAARLCGFVRRQVYCRI